MRGRNYWKLLCNRCCGCETIILKNYKSIKIHAWVNTQVVSKKVGMKLVPFHIVVQVLDQLVHCFSLTHVVSGGGFPWRAGGVFAVAQTHRESAVCCQTHRWPAWDRQRAAATTHGTLTQFTCSLTITKQTSVSQQQQLQTSECWFCSLDIFF